MWRVQRKAGLSFLNNKNLQVLTDVALPQYLQQSINYLKATCDSHREADLQAVFLEITSQLMGKMAYNVGSGPALNLSHRVFTGESRLINNFK